jgi:hypothetical protein
MNIDPTYDRGEIDANPEWQLAFSLSEIMNDNAPLGWGKIYPCGQIAARKLRDQTEGSNVNRYLIVMIIIYWLGVVLTHGILTEEWREDRCEYSKGDACEHAKGVETITVGLVWPVYWQFRASARGFAGKSQ